jgi:hypothetical protein
LLAHFFGACIAFLHALTACAYVRQATDLHYNPLLNHSAAASAAKLAPAADAAPAPAAARMPANDPSQPLDVSAVRWCVHVCMRSESSVRTGLTRCASFVHLCICRLSDALVSSRTTHTETSFEEARASFWLQRYSPPSAEEVAAAAAPAVVLMSVDVAPSEPAPCAAAPLPPAASPLPAPVKLALPAASSPLMLAQPAPAVADVQDTVQQAPVIPVRLRAQHLLS